jgi:hypothetical protein
VQANGGGSFSINGSTITGSLKVQQLPSSNLQNQVCNTTVGGDLQFQNNAAAVQIGSVSGVCAGNIIQGTLQVQNNKAATTLAANTVAGYLDDDNNGGATQVTNNFIGNDLQCQNNKSITGSGNTAKQKQGQCAGF